MQVNNNYISNPNIGKSGQMPNTNEAARRAEAVAPSSLLESSTHTPSPELMQFLSIARQTPQVRQKVLQQVAQRLADGDYLTPEAAEKTADAILNALEE